MKNNTQGYRGYIGSRTYPCGDFPQHMQNLLIRNYCQKYQLTYLLSATEYAMSGCYMMLEEVLNSLPSISGVILFSIFMLPSSAKKRASIYKKILQSGGSLHAALEELSIRTEADVEGIEAILNLHKIALTDGSLSQLWRDSLTA